MIKELIVGSGTLEVTIALLEDGEVVEIFIEREKTRGILGNIYKGRVTKVLPGMQAAFVDVGLDRSAFLHVSDFLEGQGEWSLEEQFSPQEDTRWAEEDRGSSQGLGGVKPVSGDLDAGLLAAPGTPSILPQRLVMDPALDLATGSQEPSPGWAPDILSQWLSGFGLYSEAGGGERRGEGNGGQVVKRELARNGRRKREATGSTIQNMLQENQEILVQVSKEPIGRKGSRITSHVAFPGRHLVYMPTVNHVGVSRRIKSEEERERLRGVIRRLRDQFGKGGFIVRTVGENHSEQEFQRDMQYLTRLWADIKKKVEGLSAPALVYAEPSLLERVVRDYLSKDFRSVQIDEEKDYQRVMTMVRRLSPELSSCVKLYPKSSDILDDYGVSMQIEKALRPKVWLKSGGHIVIDQTEALVAIDVNTGKYVGKTDSHEDTITKTNLEAAKELVRQIRLRDIGGIIVVDFIDMSNGRNRRRVLDGLRQELARDKAPFKVLGFNEFGLVALTRKRDKQSLERTLSQKCGACGGTGLTRSVQTVCCSIHQKVQRMPSIKGNSLIIRCSPEVAKALRGGESLALREIKNVVGRTVRIKTDPLLKIEQFEVSVE